MSQQINLSDALDLIAQSKLDIKGSVQGKGGTIGDDLTQYDASISNIKFRSILFDSLNVDVYRYGEGTTFSCVQYLDGYRSYPDNISYTMTGDSATVVKQPRDPNHSEQEFTFYPVDYGTSTLVVRDEMGNCEYNITANVYQFSMTANVQAYNNFNSLNYDDNIYIDDDPTQYKGYHVEWNTSIDPAQDKMYIDFYIRGQAPDGTEIAVPSSSVDVSVTGGSLANYIIIDSSVTNNDLRVTLQLTDGTMYNGYLMLNFSDGTSESGPIPIYFTGGEQLPEAGGEEPLNVYMMTGNEADWQGTPITDFVEASDPNNMDEYGVPTIVTSDCTFSCEDQNISINDTEVTANAAGSYEIIATDNNTGRTGSVTWTIVVPA